jgi:hypothetical protein
VGEIVINSYIGMMIVITLLKISLNVSNTTLFVTGLIFALSVALDYVYLVSINTMKFYENAKATGRQIYSLPKIYELTLKYKPKIAEIIHNPRISSQTLYIFNPFKLRGKYVLILDDFGLNYEVVQVHEFAHALHDDTKMKIIFRALMMLLTITIPALPFTLNIPFLMAVLYSVTLLVLMIIVTTFLIVTQEVIQEIRADKFAMKNCDNDCVTKYYNVVFKTKKPDNKIRAIIKGLFESYKISHISETLRQVIYLKKLTTTPLPPTPAVKPYDK